MTTKRFMLRREFWLNLRNPEEEMLAGLIDQLKEQRLFAKTIRDGIHLICDLRAGRLDVLFELFPWVRAEFLEYMQSLQPQKTAGEVELQTRLDRMEKLLLEQGNVPIASTASGPKPLVVAAVAALSSDHADDDLLTIRKAQSNGDSARNFLDSAFSLIQ